MFEVLLSKLIGDNMIRVLLFVFTVSVVTSLPINNDAQMMDLGDIDTALVESTIREVRAAPDSEVIDLLQAGKYV